MGALRGVVLRAVFFPTAFLAAVLRADFFTAALLVEAFLGDALLATVFLAGLFLAIALRAVFLSAPFLVAFRAVLFFAAAFLAAFLVVAFTMFDLPSADLAGSLNMPTKCLHRVSLLISHARGLASKVSRLRARNASQALPHMFLNTLAAIEAAVARAAATLAWMKANVPANRMRERRDQACGGC